MRTTRIGAAALWALCLVFAVTAAPASAVLAGHTFDFEFGGGTGTGVGQFETFESMGVGIDETNNDVYVVDANNSRIQKFDEHGNFILMWGYGVKDGKDEFQVCEAPGPCQEGRFGNAPGQMQHPSGIAVDNSSGPNHGDVYVTDATTQLYGGDDAGRNLILKYSSNGAYLGSIDGGASPSGVFGKLPWHRGVDVDEQGFVWVADEDQGFNGRILRFSNQVGNAYVGGSEWRDPSGIPMFSMAVAPDGSAVYIQDYEHLYRYVANGSASRVVTNIGDGLFGNEIAVDPATGHIFVDYGSEIQEWVDGANGGEKLYPVFGPGHVTSSNGMAVNGNNGEIYVADPNEKKVYVFKPRRVPETLTQPATEVVHTTGTMNAHVAPDTVAGGDVSQCYFEWGLTTTYEHKTACEQPTPIGAPATVTLKLSGLLQEETYHYRIEARNSIDVEYGKDETFTPHAVLSTVTQGVEGLTASTATLTGSFDANNEETEYFFEWGRQKANLNHTTPLVNVGTPPGATVAVQRLEGLEDYTTYFYRLGATNALGTSYGEKLSFKTTPPALPTVASTAVGRVSDSSALLSAAIMPNFGDTMYGFEWGESVAYGSQKLGTELLPADGQSHSVGLDIDGLTAGQVYHYRAVAINFGGITHGSDQTFTTLAAPKVISTTATSVGTTAATFNALVQPSLSLTMVRFEYGASTAYGSSTGGVPLGAGEKAVTASLAVSGLTERTTYHLRAVASNAVGTVVGPDQTFETARAPTPPVRCRHGFVMRRGKCVKKKRIKRHHRHTARGPSPRGE